MTNSIEVFNVFSKLSTSNNGIPVFNPVRNVAIRFILSIVVLVQSFAAVTDASTFHPSGDQHEAVIEHLHSHDVTEFDTSENNTDSFKNHHCCHCHGMASTAVPSSSLQLPPIANLKTVQPSYRKHYTSRYPTSLYRPPIV